MLSLQSQCLLRQKEIFNEGRWLLVNPSDPSVFNETPDNVFGFHQYYDQYLAAVATNDERHFFGMTLPDMSDTERFDGIILYLPKAKKQTVWLLQYLATLLKPQGVLGLIGENKGGIKSSGKLLEAFGGRANKLDSARHCSLLVTVINNIPHFNLEQQVHWSSVNCNGEQFELASIPGVFSHGELDAGTQLLLENINKVPGGRVLDFACGSGVIGAWLKHKNPDTQLTLCDINANGLYCAEATLAKAEIRADVVPSDGLDEVSGRFAAIYSNPPFHSGISTDYSVTERFIANAHAKLQPGGELWLVANRFLPYPEQLQSVFGGFKKKAETSKFTLYFCKK